MNVLSEETFDLCVERLVKEEKWRELESILCVDSVYLNTPKGERFYKVALLLLNQCRDSFDGDLYKKAVDFLLAAFQESYRKNDVLQLLEQIIWSDNVSEMKRIYEANLSFLKNEYAMEGLPPFEELPFLLLPVTETYFRMYDKSKEAFLLRGQHNRVYDLYALLMCRVFEKADVVLVEKVAAWAASQQATLLWEKMKKTMKLRARFLWRKYSCIIACDRIVRDTFG